MIKRSVLYVEDDPEFQKQVIDLIAGECPEDFNVITCSTFQEALQALRALNIDIILLDLGLPDAQFPSTYKALAERSPETPIVILTGTDDDTVSSFAVSSGADDLFVKQGISGRALCRALHIALARKARDRGQTSKHQKRHFFSTDQMARLATIQEQLQAITHELRRMVTDGTDDEPQ
jgi:DNA-binding response OmpR family regulator